MDTEAGAAKEPSKPVDPNDRGRRGIHQALLQAVGIVGTVGLALYDQRTPGDPVPSYVYGVVLALALGVDPIAFLKGLVK